MKNKLLLLCICLLLTGCYNYRELNDMSIVSAIGISKEESDYKITMQFLKTEKEGKGDTNLEYAIYNTRGKTIQEALRTSVNETSKIMYINHMELLLIDEKVAKENIKEVLDYFFREPEARKQFLVAVTKENIEDLLNAQTLSDKINGKSIKETITKNEDKLGYTAVITFGELIQTYINPYKELYLPSIVLEKQSEEIKEKDEANKEEKKQNPEKRIKTNETAIFKNNKLISYIAEKDNRNILFIKDKIKTTVLTEEINNSNVSLEIIESKTRIKTNKNNIEINIKMKGNISDITLQTNIKKNNTIKKIENIFEDKTNKSIKNTIENIIKKYDTDVFGFIDLIYKNDNKYFVNYKPRLKDINIIINTSIDIESKGNGDNTIYESKTN